jgi:hypothetical protein
LLLFPQRDTEYVHFEDAQNNPFDHRAQGFSRVNAWWLADAALLAYSDEGPARPIWKRAGLRLELLANEGVQCHIGYSDNVVIVAFRGTQPDNWHNLIDIGKIDHSPWQLGGAVHAGFLEAHKKIWPRVEQTLKRLDPTGGATWFTGHSLGAALATLSMDRWSSARGLYTIGSPPVGNRRFARRFDPRHAGRCFRYVNHRDLIVYVAGWLSVLIGNYTHVKARKYIDAQGAMSTGSQSIADWFALLGTRGLLSQLANLIDAGEIRLLPDGLIDHTPRRYAVLIWNDYESSNRR